MKKLIFVVLFLSLGIFASAGYSLSFDSEGYFPDGSINLTPGVHPFILSNDEPLIGGVNLILALHPITAAHFIRDIQPLILPDAWTWYPIVDPEFPDYDLLFIQFSSPDPTPIPIGNLIEFSVDFTGPAADFEVWDGDGMPLLGPYHLVPEPTSLLLLGLGGLALRMRKK